MRYTYKKQVYNYNGKVGNEILPVFPRKDWENIIRKLMECGILFKENVVFSFMGKDGCIPIRILDLKRYSPYKNLLRIK